MFKNFRRPISGLGEEEARHIECLVRNPSSTSAEFYFNEIQLFLDVPIFNLLINGLHVARMFLIKLNIRVLA